MARLGAGSPDFPTMSESLLATRYLRRDACACVLRVGIVVLALRFHNLRQVINRQTRHDRERSYPGKRQLPFLGCVLVSR